ncbi:MAG TPA: hypothetical protein VN132_05260 [Bdellovibrio sp.]|nr:hypothetical protein [Bdellovibrio sp.]
MKLMLQKTMVLVALSLSSQMVLANIQANIPAYAVKCSPQIPFQGEVATVVIPKGPRDSLNVKFYYGNIMGSVTSSYVAQKSESADYTYEYYQGQGFSLTVNTRTARANLNAVVNGNAVELRDLVCKFNEKTPLIPGVTMGN